MMRADRIARELAKAYFFGTGFAADVPGGGVAFLKSRAGLDLPDIQLLLTAAPLGAGPYFRPFKPSFTDGFASRGAGPQHGAGGPLPVMPPDAELSPVVRANLTVISHALVLERTFSGTRVSGVTARIDGRPITLSAGTTILSAGAIGSPLLLMRSGIGPAASPERAGVACHSGHDHLLTAGNVYRARRPVPTSRLQHSESLTYLNTADLTCADGAPDAVVGCVAAPTVTECFERPASGTAYTLLSGVTHPTSRGRITLSGPAVDDPPRIDPQF